MTALSIDMSDHDYSYGWEEINPAQHYHCKLRDRAEETWKKSREIVSEAEDRLELGKITREQWYEVLTEAGKLQDTAVALESLAVDAQIAFWKAQYAEAEMREAEMRQKEWTEQQHDERPV
jgi:hypothetical protein